MHVETSFRWNLGDLICVRRHVGPAHEGNSRTLGMHAGEESDGCIVPVKPRTMPSDIGGGDGGGKAAGRGEGELRRMPRTQRRNQHVTEAASPRIGAAWVPHTPKANHVRPETGARCVSSARRDLRGGRGAILVPTATKERHDLTTRCTVSRAGDSEHLEIFALLPLRNFGLEARDLGVLDRQEVVDEAGAQILAEEGVPAQR